MSIASPSAAAFFLSLAFALAVVDRTAAATLVTVSFFGGFIGEGYAKRLGLTFETNSNFGAYITRKTLSTINASEIEQQHTRSELSRPMIPVGSNARDAQ